jgi:FAD/FMN-containing dehydrogenase
MTVPTTALSALKNIVGDKGFIDDAKDMVPHTDDWRGRKSGKSPLILFPTTVQQVSDIVKISYENDIKLVPQGGNTGLVLGGIPSDDGDEVVVNLARMNKIINVDAESYTLTCEAGVILQSAQKAALENNRLFPLNIAAEGSCHIGGNIATNAGGIHVLRYGNMREQVLGLEVVLPNGEIWNGLKALRKDNAGYDLKQMFIGAEGTLGIITKATLKLVPKPSNIETAMIGINSPEDTISLLAHLRSTLGDGLVAFEIFPHNGLEIVLKNMPNLRNPMQKSANWYAICELWGFEDSEQLNNRFTKALMKSCDDGLARDVILASSEAQRKDFWNIRELFAPALKIEGAGIAFDISIPLSQISCFLKRADKAVKAHIKGIKTIPFGHAGDGNLHYNIAPPDGMSTDELLIRREEIVRIVHDIANDLDGSIAAEHGVGTQKTGEILRYKSASEIAMFKALKNALDPKGLMNAGRIISKS